MRRFTAPSIALLAILTLVIGWRIYAHDVEARHVAALRVLQAPSVIRLRYRIAYLRSALSFEEYAIENLDGKASVRYSASDRAGNRATFTTPVGGFDVSVLFEELVRDGVWEMESKKPAGNREIAYAVAVEQSVENQHGKHAFTFTDPHYWEANAGRVYHLDLASGVPNQNDLLRMKSSQLAEPRYAKIVADFSGFGPEGFRKNVALARAKLRGL